MPRTLGLWIALTGWGAMFVMAMLLAAVVLGARAGASGAEASPAASPAGPSGPVGTIKIRAFDLGFDPPMVHVAAAGTYAVTLVNDGGTPHDLTFADGTKIEAAAHTTSTGEVTIPAAGLTFICSVPGHADAGMRGAVMVGGDGPATPAASTPASAEQLRDADAARTAQFPAKTEGRGNQVLQPKLLKDGTKQWELTASVIKWETEPGTVLEAYAYNGTVPGPQLHAQVGDKVRVILHNELTQPITIHFHGQVVPNAVDGVPAITQSAVLPGESFTYEFTVRNAGSHMYHSHFMADHQVPMGLLGAFIVTDPKAANQPAADIDYSMILNDGPLGFTLNGKGFPATEPIVAKLVQTIRVRYMNEGLQIHPMHLHGIPQFVIAKDGYPLPDPHYEDTVLVAPGERIDVLIRASELGIWAFHCHILTHAEGPDGMFGMVTALIVEEK
ncbi:MAG: multicopper oxidase domain-containing protein [Chloroflexota bacterium]|nr:multicopper oxidase domain-containing protein [Chloroflexota bacterium]